MGSSMQVWRDGLAVALTNNWCGEGRFCLVPVYPTNDSLLFVTSPILGDGQKDSIARLGVRRFKYAYSSKINENRLLGVLRNFPLVKSPSSRMASSCMKSSSLALEPVIDIPA